MQKSAPKMELLAPSGSVAQLKAALAFGADAVYLGLGEFSARAKAVDFTSQNLEFWTKYAHNHGAKVYLTMNTLIKKDEFERAIKMVEASLLAGVDAFIMQDLGLMCEAKRLFPNCVIHASTQSGVHNVPSALAAKKLGCSRAVLSREAGLKDIRAILANVDIEIEYFAHGALCVGFSGNCYFSSLVSAHSGNRGRCMQLCRKRYSLLGSNTQGCLISPKDLCLVNQLGALGEAGVCSIKIEGRLRRHEYVGEVVRIYRKMLDEGEISAHDIQCLHTIYNRGSFCEGYLHQPSPKNIIYPHVQGHLGVLVGKITSVKGNIASISKANLLKKGDGVKILRKNTEICGGMAISENAISFAKGARVGDEVYLTTQVAQLERVNRVIEAFEKL